MSATNRGVIRHKDDFYATPTVRVIEHEDCK